MVSPCNELCSINKMNEVFIWAVICRSFKILMLSARSQAKILKLCICTHKLYNSIYKYICILSNFIFIQFLKVKANWHGKKAYQQLPRDGDGKKNGLHQERGSLKGYRNVCCIDFVIVCRNEHISKLLNLYSLNMFNLF